MNKFLVFIMLAVAAPAYAMNETADMLRRCEGVNVVNADNYILRCVPDKKITKTIENGAAQFFAADNDGDVRGSFLDQIPDNDDFVYVNVIRNSPDSRYADQICYRFVKEKDAARDGYYAVEVCEYERADYYL